MYRRREFIAGSLSLMTVPVLAQDVPPAEEEAPQPAWLTADIAPGATVYVAPDGKGDGLSWASAAPLEAVGALIDRITPGGQVCLLADQPFQVETTIEITAAGQAEAPVRIVGMREDGAAGQAQFVGTRTVWAGAKTSEDAVDASAFGGNTLFKLSKGAGYLHFAGLHVSHFAIVLDLSGSDAKGIVVEDVEFFNIRDGIYTDDAASVSDLTLRRFSGRGFSKKAVRFHGTCTNWLIQDCDLDSGWQYGDNFAVGIEAHDSAHGLHIVGGRTINCMDTQGDDPEQYWNGDGVASERDNHDILIEDHVSAGHTDSGYDLKSEQTELRNCVSEDNKRNYRLWGGIGTEPMVLVGCSSLAPRKRGGSGGAHHIWVSGGDSDEDVGGSVVFIDGTIDGEEPEEAIHVEGGNAAVHLVDTSLGQIDRDRLFVATKKSSVLIEGSASDAGVTAILTDSEIKPISGATTSLPLEADAVASWRIAEKDGIDAWLDGSTLVLTAGAVSERGQIIVQARDSAGRATPFVITTESVENPVAAGAVLSLAIAADGSLTDATGMHAIEASDESEVVDGAFHFRGKGSYFTVDASDNFALDGPFWIETTFKIEDRDFALPADVLTVWKTSGDKRAFRIGLTEDRSVAFFWSTDGDTQEQSVLVGPVLKAGVFYTILVDRGPSGIIRLYVDGVMAAKTAEPVGAFYASSAPLRVAGRPDGKQAASGFMKSLTIVKGSARCDSDDGCAT
ncbi:LamG-like jellyroll fold domain-containing protein [Devosia sp.]|uniref:LamG-like jellyroll fold domain-containing protein n=1 Tax=Devosia sp. TaxID=1871048 RepID=UPI001A080EBC|nr:LamG-like jellyroll fold domain-containing protein [Devosia sp.]MBE0579754.1 hypothetical protein [Devosia sp.]